jgi:hypothetical protein
MLERCVGDTPLPEGSIVFGTSNNQSDGVGDTMLAHAGNRVCIVQMEKPDVTTWLTWATNNKVSALVRAFVHTFPRCLASYTDGNQDDNPYIFNPKKPQLSFVSPRSLAKCSTIVDNRDSLGENTTMAALGGTIGQSASADMSAFMRLESQLPKFDDIITNPETTPIPEQISAQLMLMFQAVDKVDTQATLTAFMKYLKRIASSEMQAVFFTMLVRHKTAVKLARSNAEIAEWATKNHELF